MNKKDINNNKNNWVFYFVIIFITLVIIFFWAKNFKENVLDSKGNNNQIEEDFKKSFNDLKTSVENAIEKTKEFNTNSQKVIKDPETTENSYGYGYGEISYGYGNDEKYKELLKNITPQDIEDYINTNNEIENTLKQ